MEQFNLALPSHLLMFYAFLHLPLIFLFGEKLIQTLNHCFVFFANEFFIQDLSTWSLIEKGDFCSGLFQLQLAGASSSTLISTLSVFSCISNSISASIFSKSSHDLWHYRLGHVSTSTLQLLLDVSLNFQSMNTNFICDIYPQAKQHRLSLSSRQHTSQKPFDMIHCDIWGLCSQVAHVAMILIFQSGSPMSF